MENLKVLIVGVGGLGCPAALALASEGVRALGLVDPDRVEGSNLHRQILYGPADVGLLKVGAASAYLRGKFPGVEVRPFPEAFGADNAARLLEGWDLVIDGLDRLEKKFILNDQCVKLGKPFVHAGVVRFEGQVLAVRPGKTACLRCLIPRIPPPFAMPTCREAGVLGAFSQAVGYFQAEEALRMTGSAGPFRLWKMDLEKGLWRSIVPGRDPSCGACGTGKPEAEERVRPGTCAAP